MRTLPSSNYISWKGTGINSFPIGTTPGHIRPLTNNDPGNVFPTGFGLARPIKHYRKGRVITHYQDNEPLNNNLHRFVKSNKGETIINDMIDKPGAYSINESNNNICQGITVVADYMPNRNFLEENPEPVTQNKILCCNDAVKARRRAMYASTNISKNYYTTTKQYLQNRCNTYNQKSFNFDSTLQSNESNIYVANCYASTDRSIEKMLAIMVQQSALTQYEANSFNNNNSLTTFWTWLQSHEQARIIFIEFVSNPYNDVQFNNQSGCKLTVYKPNNQEYAQQGAVDSSTRNLKLNVDTISTNSASIQNYNNTGDLLVDANQLYSGVSPNISNLLKNKNTNPNTRCNSKSLYNKKMCFLS
jgi:hypothetical protein